MIRFPFQCKLSLVIKFCHVCTKDLAAEHFFYSHNLSTSNTSNQSWLSKVQTLRTLSFLLPRWQQHNLSSASPTHPLKSVEEPARPPSQWLVPEPSPQSQLRKPTIQALAGTLLLATLLACHVNVFKSIPGSVEHI